MDVCTVVQQVLHRSRVSTATCCDEGRVAAVTVLTVELGWILREDSEQPTDVSSIRWTLGTFLLLGGLEGAPLFFLCGEDELQQQAQVGRARGAHAKLS